MPAVIYMYNNKMVCRKMYKREKVCLLSCSYTNNKFMLLFSLATKQKDATILMTQNSNKNIWKVVSEFYRF